MWLSSFYFQPQTTALYWAERALKLSLACRDYTYKNQLDLTQSQQKFRLKYIQYIGVTYIHGSHFNSFLHEWKVSNVENSLNIPPKFQTCYTQKGMAYESETTKVWEIGAMYVNTVIVSTYLGTRYMGCTLVPLQCNALLGSAVGGCPKTTLTKFCPILTTYLPNVDMRWHLN